MKDLIIKIGNNNKFKITNQKNLYFFSRGGSNKYTQAFTIKEIENGRVYTKYVTSDMKCELLDNINYYRQALQKFYKLTLFL